MIYWLKDIVNKETFALFPVLFFLLQMVLLIVIGKMDFAQDS